MFNLLIAQGPSAAARGLAVLDAAVGPCAVSVTTVN